MRAVTWTFMACLGVNAQAAALSTEGLYAGGGIGSADEESHTVLQLYLGADLAMVGPAELGLEAGYAETDVGDAEVANSWVSGMAGFVFTPDVRALVRAGADFGDDPGGHVGVGFGYRTRYNLETRIELRVKDGDQTMLLDVSYYPFRH